MEFKLIFNLNNEKLFSKKNDDYYYSIFIKNQTESFIKTIVRFLKCNEENLKVINPQLSIFSSSFIFCNLHRNVKIEIICLS